MGRRHLCKGVREKDMRLSEGKEFQGKANAKPQGRHVTECHSKEAIWLAGNEVEVSWSCQRECHTALGLKTLRRTLASTLDKREPFEYRSTMVGCLF